MNVSTILISFVMSFATANYALAQESSQEPAVNVGQEKVSPTIVAEKQLGKVIRLRMKSLSYMNEILKMIKVATPPTLVVEKIEEWILLNRTFALEAAIFKKTATVAGDKKGMDFADNSFRLAALIEGLAQLDRVTLFRADEETLFNREPKFNPQVTNVLTTNIQDAQNKAEEILGKVAFDVKIDDITSSGPQKIIKPINVSIAKKIAVPDDQEKGFTARIIQEVGEILPERDSATMVVTIESWGEREIKLSAAVQEPGSQQMKLGVFSGFGMRSTKTDRTIKMNASHLAGQVIIRLLMSDMAWSLK